MRKLSVFFAAFAMMALSGQAAAQFGGPNILFLDQQRVLSESKAGQSIDSQLQTMAEQVATELQTAEAALNQEAQTLQSNQETLSKEEFGKRYQVLMGRVRGLEQLKQIRQAELNQARTKAVQDLAKEWDPIIQELFKKRKGTVLLEKQAVLESTERGDITADVIKELDDKVTTVQVVKPDLQAQLAAAQQAQQVQAAGATQ
jgi:outer membrane protein